MDKGKDFWFFPGGKLDEEENLVDALIREVKEEVSVDLVQDTIRIYGIFEAEAQGKSEKTILRSTCFTANFSGEVVAANEIGRAEFIDYSAGIAKSSETSAIVFNHLLEKGLIE